MSIAGRVVTLVIASIALAPSGAAFADGPRGAQESPPAESAATPANVQTTAPTPAEPVPAGPAAPPVMPTTVVRPSGVESAVPPAANATAPPKAAATPPPAVPSRSGVIELGRPARAASRWHGFPISLSLRDAPLPEVLRSFARIAGVNLVLAPGVTGSVTVELKDVPWDQALWVILKTHGLGAEIDGRVWSVAPY